MLPKSLDKPELLIIKAEAVVKTLEDESVYHLWKYWINPELNYMCVRYEQYQLPVDENFDSANFQPDPDQGDVREIIEYFTTPQGWLSPKTVKKNDALGKDGQRIDRILRVRLDTSGKRSDELFNWPEGVPLPEK